MLKPQYARHADNKQHRKDRGTVFLEDTERWKHNNEHIPPHQTSDMTTLRCMSWNVRYWTDCMSNPSHAEIFEVIKTINPDVLILQEAKFDVSDVNAVPVDTLLTSFNQLGFVYGGLETLGTIWSARNTRYGVVIFSKYPLENIYKSRYQPTELWAENNSFVRAYVTKNDAQIAIYATHIAAESTPILLTTAEQTRAAQLKQISMIIAHDACLNAFIVADFNAVRKQDLQDIIDGQSLWDIANKDYQDYVGVPRSDEALSVLSSQGYKNSFEYLAIGSPKVTTWSGIAVDHFFLRPEWNLHLKGSYVYFTEASDHYPIIIDIRV